MLKAYDCSVRGYDGQATPINAESAGKAKSLYLREHLDDCGIPYTQITCRYVGEARAPLPTRTELAQRECDAFNARYPVGTMLRYWSWTHEGEPTGTAPISHPATVTCEHAVIWLKGVSSCHSITHVEEVEKKTNA